MGEKKLVTISIKRNNGEVEYKVACSKEVTSEELAHYLDEIIEGICTWKPEVCEDTVSTIIGTIKNKQKT